MSSYLFSPKIVSVKFNTFLFVKRAAEFLLFYFFLEVKTGGRIWIKYKVKYYTKDLLSNEKAETPLTLVLSTIYSYFNYIFKLTAFWNIKTHVGNSTVFSEFRYWYNKYYFRAHNCFKYNITKYIQLLYSVLHKFLTQSFIYNGLLLL